MKQIDWNKIYGVILDMDGVIYNGNSCIESAIKAINIWQKNNIKICFLTNNSTKTQLEFSKKLKDMNLFVKKESIISTSICTANYLEENYSKKTKVYIVGSRSLKDTILKRGFVLDDKNASIVIVGLDINFSYKMIDIASNLVRRGAHLIGTNLDKIYPTNEGFKPGAGSLMESILASSNKKNCIFIGKPNPYFVKNAVRYLNFNTNNIVLIGDQLETDILAANKARIFSVLVKTGIKNNNKIIKPNLVINSLMNLPLSKKQT